MSIQSILAEMKTPLRSVSSGIAQQELVFCIQIDKQRGGYLQVLDKAHQVLTTLPDYTQYRGETRQLLKSLAYIQSQGNDWDGFDWIGGKKLEDRVWLDQHPLLFNYLRHVEHLVDKNGKPLTFSDDIGQIVLSIEPQADTDHVQTAWKLQANDEVIDKFQPLSDAWAIAKGGLYEFQPIGDNGMKLKAFETILPKHELGPFLSLVYSSFSHIELVYEDFSTMWLDDIMARPALFFDRVDAYDSLFLRVAHNLPSLNPEMFGDFMLTSIADVQDAERQVVLRNIEYDPLIPHIDHLAALLKKVQKSLKGEDEAGFVLEHDTFIIEKGLAQAFVYKNLSELIGLYTLYGAEKLKSYRVRPVVPKLNLFVESGLDFLEGSANLQIEGEDFSLFDAIQQLQRKGYVQLSDGTQALINNQYMRKLERIFKKQKDGNIKVSFFDLPIVADMIDEQLWKSTMPRAMEVYEGFNTIKKQKTKLPGFQGELRPYQKYGVEWMHYLKENNLGGCLADDMGLGKTPMTIGLLSTVYPKQEKPTLIIMPTTLLFNWESEIKKFNPNLTYYTYYGQNRDMEEAKKHNLIFTTYSLMRIDIEKFNEIPFYYVILDESQNIKNLETQASKAVMLLQAEQRLALSGTPIENNLGELYSLFRFLNPAMFGSADDFGARYAYPIQKQGDAEAAEELRKKIYPFVLRRLKKNVLKELPDRIDHTMIVEMSPEQARYYEARRRYYYDTVKNQVASQGIERSQFFILQALSELRQIATIPEAQTEGRIRSPKRELLMQQVSDALANGHKALIFTNFLAAIEAVGEDLTAAGIEFVSMTGATTNRRELVKKFTQDPKIRVFLMTMKTGGVGLNLTVADHVFIMDPWWNTAAENQAIDRTHRMGQDKTVFSHKLIAKGSIEEKILLLQEQKKALFDAIIASDGASIKSLSKDDIEFILG